MKKLAVLMPTYNAAPFLKDSIASLINQTFTDFDLYIYDDCSTDNTKEIISFYTDNRIFYRKNITNFGISKTLNLGLEELLLHYEYIARMDADDWCYPERLEKQIKFMDENFHIDVSGTQGYWLKNINQNPLTGWKYPTQNEYIKYYLLFAATFGHSSVIFRSESLIKHNLRYDETVQTCEDWNLWVRFSKIGKMANLPHFLMKYRILEHSNHRSDSKTKLHFEERSKIIANHWSQCGLEINPKTIFELYYDVKKYSKTEFYKKLKKQIQLFNFIFEKASKELVGVDKEQFSYLICRRVLNFWKRSKKSRWNPLIWIMIVQELKVAHKLKIIKNIIR